MKSPGYNSCAPSHGLRTSNSKISSRRVFPDRISADVTAKWGVVREHPKDGKPKQVMGPGEYKSLTTDRVILIPGPRNEIAIVRTIFSLAAVGNGASAIARELNNRGMTTRSGHGIRRF